MKFQAVGLTLLPVQMLVGLGLALRVMRKEAGLTQGDLAEKASLNPTMLSRYERGARTPQIETLDAILVALGTDLRGLADALDTVNGRTPPLSIAAAPQDAEGREQLDHARKLLSEADEDETRFLANLFRARELAKTTK